MQYWFDGNVVMDYHDVVMRTGQNADMKFTQFIIAPWIGRWIPHSAVLLGLLLDGSN